MSAEIYGLYDSSGALRYIGKADNSLKRLASHMRDSRRRETPLYRWIRKNGVPEMRVLECTEGDWRECEKRLIREARERGEKLLNVAEGGDEPHCSPEVRTRNGHELNRRLDSDPKARKLQQIKRQVANGLKHGHLGEGAKQRFRDLAAYRPDLFSCWKNI